MINLADDGTQAPAITTPMRLLFASEDRAYAAELGVDLFGDWIVTQCWSGRFTWCGGGKTISVADCQSGLALLRRIVRRRTQRGYRLLSSLPGVTE